MQKKIEKLLQTFVNDKNIRFPTHSQKMSASASNFISSSGAEDMSGPSLCIPRVFANITEKRVAFVVREVGLGEIDRIDMVPKTSDDGTKFQRVFIHFKRWNSSEAAQRARERVLSGKEIKIVYDDPWFWKLSANRAVQRAPREDGSVKQRPQQRPRPRLVDDEPLDQARHCKKQQQKPHRNTIKVGASLGLREPSSCLEEMEAFEPRSPSSPPPSSTGLDVDSPVVEQPWTTVDYGNLPTPKKGKRVVIKKPRLQVQENA